MILEYDLNGMHEDTKFSREFCMGIPNSLGNFA